ncbi:MAG: hypothetical protein ACJA08_001619 [Cyclobacteriaceae bacterium]|jgi:hypothetical protein
MINVRMHIFLIFIIFISGCTQKSRIAESSSIISIADDNCELNTARTYQLCVDQTNGSKENAGSIEYSLKDAKGMVVYSGSIDSGRVAWLDDLSIEIYQTPGMISTEFTKDDITKVYVILDEKIVTKTNYLETK